MESWNYSTKKVSISNEASLVVVIPRFSIECRRPPYNKQLQRTVTRRRGRAARAPFHYARASALDSWSRGR
jgi:hypothetical protein